MHFNYNAALQQLKNVPPYRLPFFLLVLMTVCISLKTIAQDNDSFAVTVNFHSICCGVPSDQLLNKKISAFKIKYRIRRIEAVRIGPLGREGEYSIGFPLKEMNTVIKRLFIRLLGNTVKQMNDRGIASIAINVSRSVFENTGANSTPVFY